MKFLLFSLIVLPVFASAQGRPVFKASAATSNITPPLGMEIVRNSRRAPLRSMCMMSYMLLPRAR